MPKIVRSRVFSKGEEEPAEEGGSTAGVVK
jgi:hypothetical protein